MNTNSSPTLKPSTGITPVDPATGQQVESTTYFADGIFTPTAHIPDQFRLHRPLAVLNRRALDEGTSGDWGSEGKEFDALEQLEREAQAAIDLGSLCRLEKIRREIASRNPAGQNDLFGMTSLDGALDQVLTFFEDSLRVSQMEGA